MEGLLGDTMLGLYILYGSLEFLYCRFDLLFQMTVRLHVSMRGGSRATLNILLIETFILMPALASDPWYCVGKPSEKDLRRLP